MMFWVNVQMVKVCVGECLYLGFSCPYERVFVCMALTFQAGTAEHLSLTDSDESKN